VSTEGRRTFEFFTLSAEAVADERLRTVLRDVIDRFRSRRRAMLEAQPDWDELRRRARAIKRHTVENLGRYLTELEASVERAGGKVHWARDGREAARIVSSIAASAEAKIIVKSKSMTTEEIGLNEVLESEGYRVVETDLGEYIIQLAGERPSHIIAPAIHKGLAEISRLFQEKLGIPPTDDADTLAAAARTTLRQTFLEADMGVSGVNFAVAETGTVAVVENEGNARFVTTVPRVHVAVMGIEKVLPRFEHLGLFLGLLVKSATGQKISTYVSLITGPRRPGERDGPEEFHLVLLDNGRSRIAADPERRESLYCLRCGACLNVCPVYRQVGGHPYGGIYSGPIGAIITPQLFGLDSAHELPFASSLCGACRDVCPVEIDIPRILVRLRNESLSSRKGVSRLRAALERVGFRLWLLTIRSPVLYSAATRLAGLLMRPFARRTADGRRVLGRLPWPLSAWTAEREFPAVASERFRDYWKKKIKT